MDKVIQVKDKQGEAYVFHCPGCDMNHIVPVVYFTESARRNGKLKPTWAFNGDFKSPSFKPDVLVDWVGAEPPQRCHFIIRDGVIIYLIDTTHKLAGQRVEMVNAE